MGQSAAQNKFYKGKNYKILSDGFLMAVVSFGAFSEAGYVVRAEYINNQQTCSSVKHPVVTWWCW